MCPFPALHLYVRYPPPCKAEEWNFRDTPLSSKRGKSVVQMGQSYGLDPCDVVRAITASSQGGFGEARCDFSRGLNTKVNRLLLQWH